MPSETSRVRISPSQAEELAVACEMGRQKLSAIADAINAQKPTILQDRLTEIIESGAGEADGRILSRLLLGLAASVSRDTSKITGFLDGITNTVKTSLKSDARLSTWEECRPEVERLLRSKSVLFSAKTLDVSYDFERVLVAPRVLTTIRPIYTDKRDDIVGSTIVHTLRLDYFTSFGEQNSISIAVDIGDIKQIIKVCNEALDKMSVAKAKLKESWRLEILVPGEESS